MSELPTPTIGDQAMSYLYNVAPNMTVTMRKDLMTLARVGGNPYQNAWLAPELRRIRESSVHLKSPHRSSYRIVKGSTILHAAVRSTNTPVKGGYLSLMLRCAQSEDLEDVRAMIDESLVKELSPTQCITKNPVLSWPQFSSYEHSVTIPMHPSMVLRPMYSFSQHHQLLRWKSKLSSLTLYPKMSTKTVGRRTADQLRVKCGIPIGKFKDRKTPGISTADLEHYYMDTGDTISGPCEVRLAFGYNILKPRIYYAVGGTDYFASRYISKVLNTLQSEFPMTDPKRRYSFDNFPFIRFNRLVFVVYDYSAFTTQLVELHHFTKQLAFFIGEVTCKRFDTHTGMVDCRLDQLLHDYNDTCNKEGQFDISKVCSIVKDEEGRDLAIMNHHVAGMLGVYGNITSCTVLHGLFGATVCGSDDKINTIGDDAAGLLDINEEIGNLSLEDSLNNIRLIGGIASEKFKIFEEDDEDLDASVDQSWHYCKRPIKIQCGNVVQGWMPDFPIYPVCLGIKDAVHTTFPKTLSTRRGIAITQSCRLLQSVQENSDQVDDEDRELVINFIRWLFSLLSITTEGSYPGEIRRIFTDGIAESAYGHDCLATPIVSIESTKKPWYQLLESRRSGMLTRTMSIPRLLVDDGEPERYSVGMEFYSRSTPKLAMMVRLGMLENMSEYESVLVTRRNIQIFEDYMFGRRKMIYKFFVHDYREQFDSFH